MSRTSKIILGILSFLPFVILIFYLAEFFSFFFEMVRITKIEGGKPDHVFVLSNMLGLIVWALVLGLLLLGLKIYYIIHAINNKLIDQTEKIVWVLVFIFFGLVGYPAYWVSRIWNAPQAPISSS